MYSFFEGQFKMNESNIQTVMIIDDDAVSRKKLVRIFKRLGLDQIEEAGQGDEAFARLKERPVDLVMADWHMPGLTGIELLKAIRQDPTLKSTLVYLVTNEGRQAQIVSAIQAGASGYIMKPFSQKSIEDQIGHLFTLSPGSSELLQEEKNNHSTVVAGASGGQP